jgi:hypothetical protein
MEHKEHMEPIASVPLKSSTGAGFSGVEQLEHFFS